MIVVDASLVVALLVGEEGTDVLEQLPVDQTFAAPELLDLEVMSVLRRYEQSKLITAGRADEAVADLLALNVRRYSPRILVDRVWSLRKNFTPYDGAYVALAEALGAPLYTLDKKLARSASRLVQTRCF